MAEKVIWSMGYRTRIGEYKHKIVFQEKQIISDGMGSGGNVVWNDTSIIEFAAIWPLKAKEIMEGMTEKHEVSHRIRVRYQSGIKPAMRIKRILDDRIFDIGALINLDEANMEYEIFAKEVTVQ